MGQGPGMLGCAVRRILRHWRHRWRSRRELARVEPRMLRDAGIHVLDARSEARKPFWRR